MRAEIVIFVLSLSLAAAATTRKRPPSSIDPIVPNDFDDYSLYHIYPASFRDSDGDGIGDLRGVESKLDYLVESNVDAYRLAPIFPNNLDDYGYDISDYRAINPIYGNFQDFDSLIKASKERQLKVFIDLVPNHMSIRSELFKKSLLGIKPYADYFIWRKGTVLADGSMAPPNNWLSVHGGPAWTYRAERKAYYLHQFGPEQPDLNYYHTDVVQEMNSVMKFWLNKGVDGFSVGSASYLAEHKQFLDEPLSGYTEDPEQYDYTDKLYTRNQEESYKIVQGWRKVLDEFKPAKHLIIDTHTNVSLAMKYYDYGARFPLNYELISDVEKRWSVSEHIQIIQNWMTRRPESYPPNWVTGYPGKKRLVSLCGEKGARALTALSMLLPGVGVTYSGDEIGLDDPEEEYQLADSPASHKRRNHHAHKSHRRSGKHDKDDSHHDDDSHDDDSHGDDSHGDRDSSDSHETDPKRNSRNKSGKKSGSIWKVKKIGRTPFLWDDTISAGFSENPEPWCPVHDRYKELNLNTQRNGNDTFYNYYQAVSALKKSPYFKKSTLVTKQLNQDVLGFSRETDTYGKAYVLINYSKEAQSVDLSSFTGIPKELRVYYASHDSELVPGSLISDYKQIHLSESATAILLSRDHQFLRK